MPKVTTKKDEQRKGPMKQEVAANGSQSYCIAPMRDENHVRRNPNNAVTLAKQQ
jgi:hypothetical protein